MLATHHACWINHHAFAGSHQVPNRRKAKEGNNSQKNNTNSRGRLPLCLAAGHMERASRDTGRVLRSRSRPNRVDENKKQQKGRYGWKRLPHALGIAADTPRPAMCGLLKSLSFGTRCHDGICEWRDKEEVDDDKGREEGGRGRKNKITAVKGERYSFIAVRQQRAWG